MALNKSELNEYCQTNRIRVEGYNTARGSDGFKSTLTCGERVFTSKNSHSTKKAAENDVALVALEALRISDRGSGSTSTSPPTRAPVRPVPSTRVNTVQLNDHLPYAAVKPTAGLSNAVPNKEYGRITSLLSLYCYYNGLLPPKHNIKSLGNDKGYIGSVVIGEDEFKSSWVVTDFNMAKHNANCTAMNELSVIDNLENLGIETDKFPSYPFTLTSMLVVSPLPRPVLTPPTLTQLPTNLPVSVAPSSNQSRTTPYNQATPPVLPASEATPPLLAAKTSPPILFSSQAVPPILHAVPLTQPSNQATPPILQAAPLTHQATPLLPPSAYAQSTNPVTVTVAESSPTNVDNDQVEMNYKQLLNEHVQQHKLQHPVYDTEFSTSTVGYVGVVELNGVKYRSQLDVNKKRAQNLAAGEALKALGIIDSQHPIGGNHHFLDMVSYKNKLQEYFQKYMLQLPQYETNRLPNERFQCTLSYVTLDGVNHTIKGTECTTKKSAEQSAAHLACVKLKIT